MLTGGLTTKITFNLRKYGQSPLQGGRTNLFYQTRGSLGPSLQNSFTPLRYVTLKPLSRKQNRAKIFQVRGSGPCLEQANIHLSVGRSLSPPPEHLWVRKDPQAPQEEGPTFRPQGLLWSWGSPHPQRHSLEEHGHQVHAIRPQVFPVSVTQLHKTALNTPAGRGLAASPCGDVTEHQLQTTEACLWGLGQPSFSQGGTRCSQDSTGARPETTGYRDHPDSQADPPEHVGLSEALPNMEGGHLWSQTQHTPGRLLLSSQFLHVHKPFRRCL